MTHRSLVELCFCWLSTLARSRVGAMSSRPGSRAKSPTRNNPSPSPKRGADGRQAHFKGGTAGGGGSGSSSTTNNRQQKGGAPGAPEVVTPSEDTSQMSLEDAAMSPQWRAVKKLLDKVNLGLESYDAPRGEKLGNDDLSYDDIDTDTRKAMLVRQNKVLIGLVDKHEQHSQEESGVLENLDSWMVSASRSLEQDDDTPVLRPNAVVGQLLNHQSERGSKLSSIQAKMSTMMSDMVKAKAAGDAAASRAEELEHSLRSVTDDLKKTQEMQKDQQSRHDSALHSSKMQQELLARQRDEARDEAATLRTSLRKLQKDVGKKDDGLLEPLQAEVKKLMEEVKKQQELVGQKSNLLRKADADVSELNRQISELTLSNKQQAKVESRAVERREVVREVRVPPPPPLPLQAETCYAWRLGTASAASTASTASAISTASVVAAAARAAARFLRAFRFADADA